MGSFKCNSISVRRFLLSSLLNKLQKIKRIALDTKFTLRSFSPSLMIFRTNYIIRCLMTIWCSARVWWKEGKEIDTENKKTHKRNVNYSICHFFPLLSCATLQGSSDTAGQNTRHYLLHFSCSSPPLNDLQTTGSLFASPSQAHLNVYDASHPPEQK